MGGTARRMEGVEASRLESGGGCRSGGWHLPLHTFHLLGLHLATRMGHQGGGGGGEGEKEWDPREDGSRKMVIQREEVWAGRKGLTELAARQGSKERRQRRMLRRMQRDAGYGHRNKHCTFSIFPFLVFIKSFASVTVTMINIVNNNNKQ